VVVRSVDGIVVISRGNPFTIHQQVAKFDEKKAAVKDRFAASTSAGRLTQVFLQSKIRTERLIGCQTSGRRILGAPEAGDTLWLPADHSADRHLGIASFDPKRN
jgi:hypothetical protein